MADSSESLLARKVRWACCEVETLASDADSSAGDENDVVSVVFDVSNCFYDAGKACKVEGVVFWSDEAGRTDLDNLEGYCD